MKTLLVLFVISAIFLSGCSVFNLNNFILPNDTEFIALVEELDTPQKIGDYMLDNFTYEFHNLYAPDPYSLWELKKGDCNDFVTFGIFVANYHGYKTYQIEIFNNTAINHWIAVYVENNGFSITDNQYYFSGYPTVINNELYFPNFDSFKQILKFYSLRTNKNWSKYKVFDYNMNLIEKVQK